MAYHWNSFVVVCSTKACWMP